MREALLRSGYLLESRIESKLRERWGYVEANPTYPDPDTDKSREFDVYAMKAYPAGPSDRDYLFGVLLIECINNPHPLLIITKEPLIGFMYHEEIKMSGLPVKFPDEKRKKGWKRLSDFLIMQDYHHYCKGRVGTQFCSFVRKKSNRKEEWMAIHEGTHYDSFKKLCDVTDYYVDKHFKCWEFDGSIEKLNVEFYFPLIVVQGELLDARESKRSVNLRSAEHLQFRRSVTTKGKDCDYQIDVIRERFLPKYLDMVDAELKKTARLLRHRHKTVRSAIDSIVADAKDAESIEKMRQIMDFQ